MWQARENASSICAADQDLKADQKKNTKRSSKQEQGAMHAVCRHDIPMAAIVMLRGEQHRNVLAMLDHVDRECGPIHSVMYDMGCKV